MTNTKEKSLALLRTRRKARNLQIPIITGILTLAFIGFGILLYIFIQETKNTSAINSVILFYAIRMLYINMILPVVSGIICILSIAKITKRKGGYFR